MATPLLKYISPEDFEELYKAAKGKKKLRLAIALGFGSGLRISEIVGLWDNTSSCCHAPVKLIKKKDDLKNRSYKFYECSKCLTHLPPQQVRHHQGDWKIAPLLPEHIDTERHTITLMNAKGGKPRITVLSPLVNEESKSLLPILMSRTTLQWQFKKLAQKTLGKNMSFHTLRHGFGNYHANIKNTPLPMIQQAMGHATVQVTGMYAKANPTHMINEMWNRMGGS